jgi:hypothetical protein
VVRRVHVCAPSGDTTGLPRRPYSAFRAAVLKSGRFSVFQATESMTLAKLFERLERDPTVTTTREGFPWIRVEERTDA